MQIVRIDSEPVSQVLYQFAASSKHVETGRLPIVLGEATELPSGVDAVLLTSDLQGIAPSWLSGGESVLLGISLLDALHQLSDDDVIPPVSNIGAIVAGDLYSPPEANKRGATGDVTRVWEEFERTFGWVIGVQGNHDEFNRSMTRLLARGRAHLLDGSTSQVGDVLFAGVSLIAGNIAKKGRRDLSEQIRLINEVVQEEPDVIVLHEGPTGGERGQKGSAEVTAALSSFSGLVICGHTHWENSLHTSQNQQTVNVDTRVILLREPK